MLEANMEKKYPGGGRGTGANATPNGAGHGHSVPQMVCAGNPNAAISNQLPEPAWRLIHQKPEAEQSIWLSKYARLSTAERVAWLEDQEREIANAHPWQAQLRTLADAYKPREPLKYLVDQVLPAGSLSMFVGEPGGLKSFLIADMAVSIAAGYRWLPLPAGGGGYATIKTPVLWIDCDNGKRRTDTRFDQLGRARGLPADTPLHYLTMPHPPLNLTERNSVEMLFDLVSHTTAGLVVIDNLGLITGEVDENSPLMGNVMGELRRLAEELGAAVVIIHHPRKGDPDDSGIKIIRGHTTIAASLDLAYHVVRDRAERKDVTLIPVKQRDGDVPILAAEFAYTKDEQTGETVQARFFGRAANGPDQQKEQEVYRAVLEVLKDGREMPQEKLLEAIKAQGVTAGKKFCREYLSVMVKRGELTTRKGSGSSGAKLYSIS